MKSTISNTPFLFSKIRVYFFFLLLGFSLLGSLVDRELGLGFPSTSGVAFGLGLPLITVFCLWESTDTLIWLIKKPDHFLEVSKHQRHNQGAFSKRGILLPIYYLYAITFFLAGIFCLILTIFMILHWIRWRRPVRKSGPTPAPPDRLRRRSAAANWQKSWFQAAESRRSRRQVSPSVSRPVNIHEPCFVLGQ